MTRIKKIIVFIIVLILPSILFNYTYALSSNPGFNVDAANKKFDQLNIKLSTQNLKLEAIRDAIRQLSTLQDQANSCVADNSAKLNVIQSLLTNKSVGYTPQGVDEKFLQQKKSKYKMELSACRLFVLRSEESLTALKKTIENISAETLFISHQPVWHAFDMDSFSSLTMINAAIFSKTMGGDRITRQQLFWLLGILVFTTFLAGYLALTCRRYYKKLTDRGVVYKITQTLSLFMIPIIFFSSCSLFFFMVFLKELTTPALEYTSYALLIYSISISILYFSFKLVSHYNRLFNRSV